MSSGKDQVLQRRLGPISDAFELKNYKQVLKLCEAGLKKDANQPYLQAYFAWAKLFSGEVEEARQLFEALVKSKPNDSDFVSGLLRHCLECSCQVEMLCEAMETASQRTKQQKGTPEVLKYEAMLFNLYFRTHNFQKASKQASLLKQLSDEPKYMLWSIMATFWQYKSDAQGSAMSLVLCERMLDKLAKEGHLSQAEDVMFYAEVLRAANKHAEARKLVEENGKHFQFEEERLKYLSGILEACGDKEACKKCFAELLEVSPDDWEAWEGFIAHAEPSEVLEVAKAKAGKKRGAWLAQIEVAQRTGAESVELLVKYFELFGNRACFWEDIGRYAVALNETQQKELLQQMRKRLGDLDLESKCVSEKSNKLAEDPNDKHLDQRDGRDAGQVNQWSEKDVERQGEMMKRVSIAKLEVSLAAVPEAEQVDRARECFRQYSGATALYRANLEVTEEGPNDDLVIVAAHHLRRKGALVESAALCDLALKHTPYAFQPKLLLIELSSELGAFGYAGDVFKLLDIKYVQMDSLGHYLLYPAVQSGNLSWLLENYQDLKTWRDSSVQRVVPMDMSKCFSHCKWSQLDGFARFSDRIAGSWHFHAYHIETVLANLLIGGYAEKSLDDIKAYFGQIRSQGLVIPVVEDRMWLEKMVDWCDTYKGKGDFRFSYNYDKRAQADYSASSLKTKKEWRDLETIVPSAEIQWLKSRVLLALALEKISSGDAANIPSTVESFSNALASCSAPNIRVAGECRDALRSMLDSTAKLAASKGVEKGQAASSYKSVTESYFSISTAFKALQSRLCEGENLPLKKGWCADIAFTMFEVVPVALIAVKSWRQFLPTKGVRNKMPADTKKIFLEMLNESKNVSTLLQEFCKAVLLVAKTQHAMKDETIVEWAQKHGMMTDVVPKEVLVDVCGKLNTSWNSLLSHVLSKGALFSHGFE